MRRRLLGRSDLSVSALGLGALHFGVLINQDEATLLVRNAIDLGINFFDTSPIYGSSHSEAILGRALEDVSAEIIVSTKVGLEAITHPDGRFGVRATFLTPSNIAKSVEQSLLHLGRSEIDLLQLHAFDGETPLEETFRGVEALIKAGKIRYFGCSNYDREELDAALKKLPAALRNKFVSFQAHYNLLERRAELELFPTCVHENLGVICNRVLARGVLSGRYRPGSELPDGSRAKLSPRIREVLTEPVKALTADLSDYAARVGKSLVEVALQWIFSNSAVTMALLGVRDVAQLDLCAQALSSTLDASEQTELDRLISGLGFDEYLKKKPETFFEK